MTNFSFHLNPSGRPGRHTGRLFIRVVHNGDSGDIPTDYRLYPDEWDEEQNRLRKELTSTTGVPGARSAYLVEVERRMFGDIDRLTAIITRLENTSLTFTASDVCRMFLGGETSTLLSYTARVTSGLMDVRKERTARAYRSAVKSFLQFAGEEDLPLKAMDAKLLKDYEVHIKEKGLSMNTLSFYMRNLKAIYNRAVRDKIVRDGPENPFADVYTGVHETKKRAFDIAEINSLVKLSCILRGRLPVKVKGTGTVEMERYGHDREYRLNRGLLDALYYFMFCFHARGMSFVDLVYLKKNDIQGDTLTYYRRKTGQRMELRVTRPMRQIIEAFAPVTRGSLYAFPLIRPGRGSERRQYESALAVQNKRLKLLSKMAGIGKNLTTHVSRHSWATIAKKEYYPVQLISEALGHNDVRTTYKYLASFEQTELDKISEGISGKIKMIS